MSRGGKRRAMVFVDGSALRDSLKKHYSPLARGKRLEAALHYEKLGFLVCGEHREFIRLNFYTSKPAFYQLKMSGGKQRQMMGEIELRPHEVHNIDRAQEHFDRLKDHIDRRGRYTTLLSGRMVPQRVDTSLDKALDWLAKIWDGIPAERLREGDRELLAQTVETTRDAARLQKTMCERLSAFRDAMLVPKELMPSYSLRLSELLGSYVEFREKGVDTFLAVDMLALCMDDAYDDAVLIAADEDYIPLAKAVMRTGRCVINAFLEIPGRADYGYQLRSACDDFRMITGTELASLVLKPSERPAPLSKSCPSCREVVNTAALRCPHCRESLVPPQTAAGPSESGGDVLEEVPGGRT